jgi:hypothetical protein
VWGGGGVEGKFSVSFGPTYQALGFGLGLNNYQDVGGQQQNLVQN